MAEFHLESADSIDLFAYNLDEVSSTDEHTSLADDDFLDAHEGPPILDEDGNVTYFPEEYANDDTEALLLSDFGLSDSSDFGLSDSSSFSDPSDSTSSLGDDPSEQWLSSSLELIRRLPFIPGTSTQREFPFTIEEIFMTRGNMRRYYVKPSMNKIFHIFPWFDKNKKAQYRQLFVAETNIEEVLEMIINMLNYWYCGRQFSEEEIFRIHGYYSLNGYGFKDHKDFMLSHIITATNQINEVLHSSYSMGSPSHNSSSDVDNSPPVVKNLLPIKERVDQHEIRITNLQRKASEKTVYSGRDRAGYLRISPEYQATRSEWCVPGGVFGHYADGIGPLLPSSARRRKSPVVYSTDPDTIEDHPCPEDPDSYAPIVMVGEAPIMLCDDSEYRKYKRLRQNVEIFVDYEGKVRCRTLRIKANSYVRRAFATAEAFSDRTPLDKQGYPCFQGVRGLRCRIHGIQDHRQIDGSDMFQHFSDMSPEQRRMQKRNLLMKGGLGLATIGAAVAVGVAALCDKESKKEKLSPAMLSNEFLILREKKKNLDTQIANLKSDPNPSNKKEHRRKLDELEEKLEKVRNKLRKVKNQLKSVS